MSRQPIGKVEFQDSGMGTRAQLVVTRVPEVGRTHLFLDLDVEGQWVRGGGDCEVGVDVENLERVLKALREALSFSGGEHSRWNRLGQAEFSWSDKHPTGAARGAIVVESKGSETRMVISAESSAESGDYVATFGATTLSELISLLDQAFRKSM